MSVQALPCYAGSCSRVTQHPNMLQSSCFSHRVTALAESPNSRTEDSQAKGPVGLWSDLPQHAHCGANYCPACIKAAIRRFLHSCLFTMHNMQQCTHSMKPQQDLDSGSLSVRHTYSCSQVVLMIILMACRWHRAADDATKQAAQLQAESKAAATQSDAAQAAALQAKHLASRLEMATAHLKVLPSAKVCCCNLSNLAAVAAAAAGAAAGTAAAAAAMFG